MVGLTSVDEPATLEVAVAAKSVVVAVAAAPLTVASRPCTVAASPSMMEAVAAFATRTGGMKAPAGAGAARATEPTVAKNMEARAKMERMAGRGVRE